MKEFLEIIKWHEIIIDDPKDFFEDNDGNFPTTDVDVLAVDIDGYSRIVQYYQVYFAEDSDGLNGIHYCFVESSTGNVVDIIGWTYVLGPIF